MPAVGLRCGWTGGEFSSSGPWTLRTPGASEWRLGAPQPASERGPTDTVPTCRNEQWRHEDRVRMAVPPSALLPDRSSFMVQAVGPHCAAVPEAKELTGRLPAGAQWPGHQLPPHAGMGGHGSVGNSQHGISAVGVDVGPTCCGAILQPSIATSASDGRNAPNSTSNPASGGREGTC